MVLCFRRRAVHDPPVEIKQIPDVLLDKVYFASVDLHFSQVLEVAVLGVGDESVQFINVDLKISGDDCCNGPPVVRASQSIDEPLYVLIHCGYFLKDPLELWRVCLADVCQFLPDSSFIFSKSFVHHV